MRIDAHQHFWHLGRLRYSWPTPNQAVLYRTFDPRDLWPHLAAARIARTVVVQAAHDEAETEYLLDLAERYPWIAGVVGWVPLDQPERAHRLLERFGRRAKFVGVRHLIHEESDPEWLLRAPVTEGLRVLAAWRVPFDVVAQFPRHLRLVPVVAERVPELRMVIDHLAKPPIRARVWEPWATQLAEAARCPMVYAKISGLITEAAETWTAADLAPYVDHALSHFGPRRLMFGSDWPVLLAAGSYERVVAATEQLLGRLDTDDQAWIFGRTAALFYGLKGVGQMEGQGGS